MLIDMTQDLGGSVDAVVADHVKAFNAHDRDRLLAGLASDVVWTTGTDTFQGRAALADVFDDGFWAMRPSLAVVDLIVTDDRAVAQMVESLTVEGRLQRYALAVLFWVSSGLIQQVKVYREGSADIV